MYDNRSKRHFLYFWGSFTLSVAVRYVKKITVRNFKIKLLSFRKYQQCMLNFTLQTGFWWYCAAWEHSEISISWILLLIFAWAVFPKGRCSPIFPYWPWALKVTMHMFRRALLRGTRLCPNYTASFLSSKIIRKKTFLPKTAIFAAFDSCRLNRW